MEQCTGQTFCRFDIKEILLPFKMVMVNEHECPDEEEDMDCVDGPCSCNGKNIVKVYDRNVQLLSLHQTFLQPGNIKPGFKSTYITIHSYKTNVDEDLGRGVPVLLSFGHPKNFLKCMFKDGKAVLTTEKYEENLQWICKDDPNTWPFVFYMSSTRESYCRFESAAYNGWFILTKPQCVTVDKSSPDNMAEQYYSIHSLQ